MAGTLALHNPKFAAKLTPYDVLASLPIPAPMGPHHKPVPHVTLIDGIREEIARRGYGIERETFALSAKGHALFGVMDLRSDRTTTERGISFGFRNSTDMSLGIRGVAGTTVFVCDNLALSGSTFAINRKNTTGLDLGAALVVGFDRFVVQGETLDVEINRLSATVVDDQTAKTIVYDALRAEVIPSRLFDDVDRFYFDPVKYQAPECEPRTLWGLHNAFTRAMRDLTPVRRFGAAVSLGRLFGMAAGQDAGDDVIDVAGDLE